MLVAVHEALELMGRGADLHIGLNDGRQYTGKFERYEGGWVLLRSGGKRASVDAARITDLSIEVSSRGPE